MENAVQTVVPDSLAQAGLTCDEANFVYNLEVLDMPVRAAASQAGVSVGLALKPHIIQARENTRRALASNLQFTKEDVVRGIHEAVHDAKLLADPMAQIKGWVEIANLLGFNKEERGVQININASIEVVKRQIRNVSDSDLIKQLGADNIIDVDFYEHKRD